MELQASLKKGTLSGFKVLWELTKVTVPTVVVVTLLDKSGVLARLSAMLGPVMAIFGLPGEAALVIVTANLVNFYAGVAAIVALSLAWKQLTILSAMIMICHGSITETALLSKAGARGSWVFAARVLAMLVVALVLNWVLPNR